MVGHAEQECVSLYYKALDDASVREEFASSLPFYFTPCNAPTDENACALTEFLVAKLGVISEWVKEFASLAHMWRARIVIEQLTRMRSIVMDHMQTMQTVATGARQHDATIN